MEKYVIFIVVMFFLFSCKNSKDKENNTNQKDSTVVSVEKNKILVEPLDKKTEVPFYIVSVSSAEKPEIASEQVLELRNKYENANYLWIPDYKSLSGKQLYSIFLGPYNYLPTAMTEFLKLKKDFKDAYCVEVSQTNKRVVLIDKYDIRVNDKKQKFIIGYADPKVEENYFDEGGDDWTWFLDDVNTFFIEHYEKEVYFCYMPEWIPLDELKKTVKEINGDSEIMGYLLIDGKNKTFLQHNLSNEIISESCNFFGLDDLSGDM